MKTLVCTVGLPRSGKSTWSSRQGVPVVNPDSIRLALHGQAYIAEMEPYVWAIAKTMAKALFLAGHDIVVVDATNTTTERRKFWRSREWITEFKEFEASKEVCLERAVLTNREDLIPVIERMSSAREPICNDESRILGAEIRRMGLQGS